MVRLYDIGEAHGWLYLVMDLVPGGRTLQDRPEVPFTPKDAARLLVTIAGAVEAIHDAGLLHLDLKPSNILLDAPPGTPDELATPRVSDFGIAYRWNDPDAAMATASMTGPVGTPSYMAPEQVDGNRAAIGPAADIHGLGAILYHMLTGRRPFAGATLADTFEQVRKQEPVPPRRLNSKIPRDLETVTLKCLEKEPSRRYASARALADDLRLWMEDRPITARPVSPPEKAWRLCRRHPGAAGLVGGLVLTLLTGFLSVFLLWRRAEAERSRAEADFQTAIELLDQIIAPIAPTGRIHVASRDGEIAGLQDTRLRLLAVATPPARSSRGFPTTGSGRRSAGLRVDERTEVG